MSNVFGCLRDAGLKLQSKKCAFCQKQVTFLGHIMSEDGVATDPAKTAKVAHWSELISVREVRQFLGLASYYHQFVKDFAIVGKPLPRLTEHAEDFKWTPDCQTAFETLRCLLVSVPVLAFPNFHRPFVLDTDASNTGIRAVLSQTDDEGMCHSPTLAVC